MNPRLAGLVGLCIVAVITSAWLIQRDSSPLREPRNASDFRALPAAALIDSARRPETAQINGFVVVLAERRSEVVSGLRAQARSGTVAERILACSIIAELRDDSSLPTLIEATRDESVKVRRRAATALRVLRAPQAAPRLREMIVEDEDLGVVKTSIAALGRVGTEADITLMAPLLMHADPMVRVTAAAGLALLGDERGLGEIVEASHSTVPAARKEATYALGLFEAEEANQRLEKVLSDPDAAWKSYAVIGQAERQLRGQDRATKLKILEELALAPSRKAAEWAVDELAFLGTAARAALERISRHDDALGWKARRRLAVLEEN